MSRICLRCGGKALSSDEEMSDHSLYDWGCHDCRFEWDWHTSEQVKGERVYSFKAPEGRRQFRVPDGCMAVECWEIGV